MSSYFRAVTSTRAAALLQHLFLEFDFARVDPVLKCN